MGQRIDNRAGYQNQINQMLRRQEEQDMQIARQRIEEARQLEVERRRDEFDGGRGGGYIPPYHPGWNPGWIPSPHEHNNVPKPGLTNPPASQNWPKGTVVTQGGDIVVPGAKGTLNIYGPGATGPNDTTALQFIVQNDKVYDSAGKEVFDLGKGGTLKLPDGSAITSTLDGSGYAHFNVISNNSREQIDYGASGMNTTRANDGSTYLQSQLGTSPYLNNTFGVTQNSAGDTEFYKLQDGKDMGRVTGVGWQPDTQKMQGLLANIIAVLNATVMKKSDPKTSLNPADFLNLVKGGDLGPALQAIQTAVNKATGQNFNFSNLMTDGNKNPTSVVTDPSQLTQLLANLGTACHDVDKHKYFSHDDRKLFNQLVGANPQQKDWGSDNRNIIDPNDKNYFVTPPPPRGSARYGSTLNRNVDQVSRDSGSNWSRWNSRQLNGGNGPNYQNYMSRLQEMEQRYEELLAMQSGTRQSRLQGRG